MAGIIYTPQLFIFDAIVQLIILISIIIMFVKTRELYNLSMQKGIKFLNNSMLFFLIGFTARFIVTLINFFKFGYVDSFEQTLFGLIFLFINIYASFMGGLYLAYCLVWRQFEKDRFNRSKFKNLILINFFALTVVAIDLYLITVVGFHTPYLFFIIIICILIFAIVMNCHHCSCCKMGGKNLNPFISLAGLGLGVYIATLIENLIFKYFYTIHYYMWGIIVVFILAFLYHVTRVSK
ncbi:hypothetical protein HN836_01975 [Candidatus Woesearchaeota archaeon]|jgi:hypothetical protein|nr:hypothetical protein [Candidatus Woesearchaeota archaeon]